nr:RNA-directed DNA polymerase, eukaryota [Tanacetum cinerariifolium]
MEERWGSTFNAQGASVFNSFITSSVLIDVQLEGGILCTWDPNVFHKEHHIISDNIVALYGTWIPNKMKLWNGESMVIGDFNEVRRMEERWGSTFNAQGAIDSNGMIRFKKKLQVLKKEIRAWATDYKTQQSGRVSDLKSKLSDIDKDLDQGGVNDDLILSRMDAMKQLQDVKSSETSDFMQKAKVRWAIEGDENSKFFHGIINRKRANLSVKGIMVDVEWVDEPSRVKDEFCIHFATRIQDPDPKVVSDYRPICLIGSLYKVVTKILATCLSTVIYDLISDVQTAFIPNRQILDGPFIINEILSRCKQKNQHAMVFK